MTGGGRERPLTPDELRRVQLVQCEMLREVDRLCRRGGIRYSIIAGTALGAVRHRGYIPWDDDADVAMLRGDYERFRELCAAQLDQERFCFQDHRATPGYRWGYGKLRRRDSLFLRLHQEDMPYEQGIFIDIFPLDNVPEPYPLRRLHSAACWLCRKAFWSVVGRRTAAGPARLAFRLLSRIPAPWLYGAFDGFVRLCERHPSPLVRILAFPAPDGEQAYLRRWYEEQREGEFEGMRLFMPRDCEEYLRFKYGADYMTPPPPERRKTHPVSALRLP